MSAISGFIQLSRVQYHIDELRQRLIGPYHTPGAMLRQS